MKVVIDTNVIVSALMNPNGVPARILALVLNGRVKAQYDNRIISEYIAVLSRKEFRFDPEIIRNLIGYFRSDGEYVNADIEQTEFIDGADKKFYEVHKSGGAQYLIAGNTRHFPREESIVTPREFVEIGMRE